MARKNTEEESYAPNFEDDETDYEDMGDEEIDISEARERVFQPLPRGTYPADVIDIEYTLSKAAGKPMLKWTFGTTVEGDDGKEHTRRLFMNDSMSDLGRVKAHILTVDPDYDLKKFVPRRVGEDLKDHECRVRVDVKSWQGKPQNEVKELLPAESGGFLP